MDKGDEEEINISTAIGIIVVVIVGLIMVGIMVYNDSTSIDSRYVTVKGEIKDVYPMLDEDGSIDYLVVTFDNWKVYEIKTGWKEVDLTVNSKIVLELKYYVERDWFWEDYEREDSYYYLQKIVKIP